MRRREFLVEAAAVLGAAGQSSSLSLVVLRVSDGHVLESRGEAETWVVPPGSAVKPFVLARLLRTGKLRPRETYLCRGVNRIRGRQFTCSHPAGLPPFDAAGILAYSCNGGVVHFAERFAPGELPSALRDVGFRVDGSADVRLQALGEEGVWATPAELARAYRRLASEGEPTILAGLEGAVQYGTAQAAAVSGISVAGKTGSATAANGLRAAWFAGFAPSRQPELVVVAALQGHSGGSDAAPQAAQVFSRYFRAAAAAGEQYRVRTEAGMVQVGTEAYVAGVLAGESSMFRQPEASQAMAIVARTFAAHERGRHRSEGFDFCATTHCQRFDSGVVPQALRAAVQATAGRMLRFKGELAFTPYTMSCGGRTEAVQAVWRDVHAPYLLVREDPFCAGTAWGCRLTAPEIERALQRAGLQCPKALRSVLVKRRTAGGRAAELTLSGEERADLDAGAFRFAVGRTLGWNLIRSNWYEMSGPFEWKGRGEGHGVGLCQRGAEQMAARGHSHREILAFYFPGTSSVNWLRSGGEKVAVYGTDLNRNLVVLEEAERLLKMLPWAMRSVPVIYLHPDSDTFRSETGEPGWVAAHTEGSRIDLQPVFTLQQRGILRNTLQHELLHVCLEQQAAPGLPLWFREGVVAYLSGAHGHRGQGVAESDLRQRNDQAKAAAAYAESVSEVQELVARYGETTVLGWVPAGLPEAVMKSRARTPKTNKR